MFQINNVRLAQFQPQTTREFPFSVCVSGGATCSSLQIKLPQGSVQGGGSERGRVPGKCASLPGKLHGHRGRHLRDVRKSERRAGLHGLTSQDAAGLGGVGGVQHGFNWAVHIVFLSVCDFYLAMLLY